MHNRNKTPMNRPRLPEEARNKLSSGGAHRNKKAHNRSAEKRNFKEQLKDSFK